MSRKNSFAKLVDTIDEKASELTELKYHDQAAFLKDLSLFIEENNVDAQMLLDWIIDYDFVKNSW